MKKRTLFLIAALVFSNVTVSVQAKTTKLQLEDSIKFDLQLLQPNETVYLTMPALPAVPGKVIVLRFFAVTKSEKPAGCNYNASLELSGAGLGRYMTGGDERLIGRNVIFEFSKDAYSGRCFPVFGGPILMMMFAPDIALGNSATVDGLGATFVMNVSDVARGVDGNVLKIHNVNESSSLLVEGVEIGWLDKKLLPKQKSIVPDRSAISDRIRSEGVSLAQANCGGFSVKISDNTELLVETAIGMDNKIASCLVADDKLLPSGVNVDIEKIGATGYNITASWPKLTMNRTIKISDGLVYWNERWTNTTNKIIGVPFRHRVFLKGQAAKFFISGDSDASALENAAKNPTVFLESKKDSGNGLGITAESDWLRLLLWLRAGGGVGEIYSETLALDAGGSIDFELTITPVKDHGGYWTFINNLRERWGSNSYCMERPYFWGYTSEDKSEASGNVLQKSLGHLGPIYLALGPWQRLGEDYDMVRSGKYPKLPVGAKPTVGKCPDLDINKFLSFEHRQAIWQRKAQAVKRIHDNCPQVKVIEMTHPAMEVIYRPLQDKWPWSADVIQNENGSSFESSTYSRAWLYGYADKDWGVFYYSPKPSSKYQAYVLESMRRSMDKIGFDGIYSDEFSWAGRRKGYSRYDYSYWDGYSADLDKQGNVFRLKADNAKATVQYQQRLIKEIRDRNKFFFCNAGTAQKSVGKLKVPCFVEGGNGFGMFSHNHLSSVPLVLGNFGDKHTLKGVFKAVKDTLAKGCIYSPEGRANLLLQGSDNFVCKLYPITIRELGPGCIKGKERLITTISENYNWPERSAVIKLYKYDVGGDLISSDVVTVDNRQALGVQVPTDGLVIAEIQNIAKLDQNGTVDFEDLSVIASDWLSSSSSAADIYPLINGDGVVGFSDFAVFAKYGF